MYYDPVIAKLIVWDETATPRPVCAGRWPTTACYYYYWSACIVCRDWWPARLRRPTDTGLMRRGRGFAHRKRQRRRRVLQVAAVGELLYEPMPPANRRRPAATRGRPGMPATAGA